MTTIKDQKQILRKQLVGFRKSFTGPGKEKADKRIFQNITHHHLYQHAQTVCTYVSMTEEVDTRTLIADILTKKEKRLVVPKVLGGIVQLFYIKSQQDLEKGTYDILEPNDGCQPAAPEDVDLFIVPGVAFARDGARIGMGKGYYDRLLKDVSTPTIGLAYHFQVFDTIPTTEDDRKIDIIISD